MIKDFQEEVAALIAVVFLNNYGFARKVRKISDFTGKAQFC
jgi:hypothetical protein